VKRAAWYAAALAFASACGKATGPSATVIAQAGGDLQGVAAADTAALPLRVRVTDGSGHPVSGVTPAWSVTKGPGRLVDVTATDTGGVSTARYVADTVAGAVTVRATAGGSVTFALRVVGGAPVRMTAFAGAGQGACLGDALAGPLVALVVDQYGNGAPGAWVRWSAPTGRGTLAADSTLSDSTGLARVGFTPDSSGPTTVTAAAPLTGSPSAFAVTGRRCFKVLGGGNNVSGLYTSDLWLARGYAYTGTWGYRNAEGNVINVWQLDGSGRPVFAGSVRLSDSTGTVSDLQVSPDSTLLVATGEYGPGAGLYVYDLTDPAAPARIGQYLVTGSGTWGLHTGTLAEVSGQLYAFTARDPSNPALLIFRIQPDSAQTIALVDSLAMPASYGIHDTFVRDGVLFVENWNSGLWIYDIGGAGHGGSVTSPVLLSTIVTSGGEVHNAWWFKNPVTHEARYVFVGQEGPGAVGSQSSGDIHVVDVSDLTHPVEVAAYHQAGAGTHNFWMDEQRQILYAAYYNGGVVALDVSGALSGDLASREIARLAPGGAGDTYVWGVMLYGGRLYAADMLSGLWELKVP
jgi:hypothetical protein